MFAQRDALVHHISLDVALIENTSLIGMFLVHVSMERM